MPLRSRGKGVRLIIEHPEQGSLKAK